MRTTERGKQRCGRATRMEVLKPHPTASLLTDGRGISTEEKEKEMMKASATLDKEHYSNSPLAYLSIVEHHLVAVMVHAVLIRIDQ